MNGTTRPLPRFLSHPAWLALSLIYGLVLPLYGCGGAAGASGASLPKELKSQGAKKSLEVLFLLSSAREQRLRNGKTRSTGTFLGEFYEPYRALNAEGHRATFVTPEGEPPIFDPEGMKDKYFHEPSVKEEALRFVRGFRGESPLLMVSSLDDALSQVKKYDALVVPGGQGVMVDIVPDERAAELVLAFSREAKPIGLICHAPALLTLLPDENPLRGLRVTSVSPFEEFFIETFVMKGKAENRKIGRQLRRRGYRYGSALPKANHAERDRNLVTSQNPFSGNSFLREFRIALYEYERTLVDHSDPPSRHR